MGIKRLKKVFVITGDENSGKTRCIKELARMFIRENYSYTDFLHTTYGEFLNQNTDLSDMNDDIFGYLSNSIDTIGIVSAGDNTVLTESCLKLLYQFQPDVIICAARDEKTYDVPDFEKIKEIVSSFNKEFLTAINVREINKLFFKVFPEELAEKIKKIIGEIKNIEEKESKIAELLNEVAKEICEKFSISEILPKNEKAEETCNDSSDDNSTKQPESTAKAENGSEKEEQESDELKTLDDLFEEIKSAIRGFDSVVVKKQTK